MIQFVLYLTQDQMDRMNGDAANAGLSLHDHVLARLALGPAQTAPAQTVTFPAELETKTVEPTADAEGEVASEQPVVARRRARG
ncbi:MAG TPA: hypothetical protein PLC98_05155 [Anaerolineales bacterium]|nr:hypothetical protein [Anaerolineales bacterium]